MTDTAYPLLYKVLNADGSCCHGGHGTWHLPEGNRPGKWMPKIDEIKACASGYHLCRPGDLIKWLGPAIFVPEARGQHIEETNKVVFQQARLIRRLEHWNERTARLFACDCAEHVLPIYEKHHPGDDRPRQAIETARRFANGQATADELAAARAAARDAAWAAARAAAWDAAWAAARAAARDAAWAAAWAAAKDAAWDAERKFQLELLNKYLTGEKP